MFYGEFISLVVAFCWTFTALSFEVAGKKVGSLAVNIIRLLIGLVFMSFYTYLSRGMILPLDASSETWFWLTISGIIGFALGDLFLFQAFIDIGSRKSMLIMTSSPVFTLILGYFIFSEIITLVQL